MSKERYLKNKEIVYDIYNIPIEDRITVYNIHHVVNRHDLGRLVPIDFDIDEKSNLYPLKIRVHELLHQTQDLLEGFSLKQSNKFKKKR